MQPDPIYYIHLLKAVFKTLDPGKMKHPNKDYQKGWNDCLNTMRREQRAFIKELENESSKSFDWRCIE